MTNEAGKGRISPVDEVQLLRAAACDWRLSRGDVGVFAVILKHCDYKWHAFPGPTTISKEASLAVSNAKASLRHLEQLGYIEVIRPGLRKANSYTVLDSPAVTARRSAEAMRKISRELGTNAYPKLGPKSYPDRDKKNCTN